MRHTSYETFLLWFGKLPSSPQTINRPHLWDCWKAAVEYGIEFGKESEHPKPTENTVSEKREGHPLRGAFKDSTEGCGSCSAAWGHFLAGAEAAEANLKIPIAIFSMRINAKLDAMARASTGRYSTIAHKLDAFHDKLDQIIDLEQKRSVEAVAKGLMGLNLVVIEGKVVHPPTR